jgi:hypothetical protein
MELPMISGEPRVLVHKVYATDFDKIYYALLRLHDPRISKAEWHQLFRKHWDIANDYYGYMLMDDKEVVGFLGTVFSKREIRGKEYNFCNLTSWIVLPGYRNKSLFLLFPILKLNDYHFTNFTAQKKVAEIHRQIGFTDIGSGAQILLPYYGVGACTRKPCRINFNHDQIADYLSGVDVIIFHDHLSLKCKHIVINSEDRYCYIVCSRVIKKKLPILLIQYISNLKYFLAFIHRAILKILLHYKAVALVIEDRFLKGHRLRGAIPFTLPQFKLFKSPTLRAEDIDNLYSERILLNI